MRSQAAEYKHFASQLPIGYGVFSLAAINVMSRYCLPQIIGKHGECYQSR